jgi:hypothetical protein
MYPGSILAMNAEESKQLANNPPRSVSSVARMYPGSILAMNSEKPKQQRSPDVSGNNIGGECGRIKTAGQ